jgi:hypothetical protein
MSWLYFSMYPAANATGVLPLLILNLESRADLRMSGEYKSSSGMIDGAKI